MMGVVLPVFLLWLGGTFDLANYQQGFYQIFGNLNHKGELEVKESFSPLYKVIESSKDVKEFFGVDARFAIEAKITGLSPHEAAIIKSSVKSRETLVEVMIRSLYIKGLEKIPPYQNVSENWQNKDPYTVGTHYVKQFAMGGQFITSLLFDCKNAEQKKKVLKAVLNNLQESGTLDKNFIGKIEKIREELGTDYVDYTIRSAYCAGCDFTKIPMLFYNLPKAVEVATKLPEIVKTAGSDYDGFGTRIMMELEDLSTISSKFPTYEENKEVIGKLNEINAMYDDLDIAYNEGRAFDSILPFGVDDKEFRKFYKELKQNRRLIVKAILNLDISPSASVSQFDEIYKAYGAPEDYQKYQKRFRVLRDQIKQNIQG